MQKAVERVRRIELIFDWFCDLSAGFSTSDHVDTSVEFSTPQKSMVYGLTWGTSSAVMKRRSSKDLPQGFLFGRVLAVTLATMNFVARSTQGPGKVNLSPKIPTLFVSGRVGNILPSFLSVVTREPHISLK
jgi:hypothetical protein